MSAAFDHVRRALASHPAIALDDGVAARAAVALVLREADSSLELLFIRRSEHPDDPWSGHMAFPGGRSEPGDSDMRVTAVRETREEIGVDLAQDGVDLGTLDEIRAMARGRVLDLSITPFVFGLRVAQPMELSSEVRSVHWIPLPELLGPGLQSQMEYVHDGLAVKLPCLRYHDVVIWGLTYRMFMSFREKILQAA